MASEKLELPIGVPVETNADAAASSVESLREQIMGSTAEIKAMAGTLRQLRGSSDEVKAAKAQLTAKMDSLKNSVSGASLALVKQGSSYDAAAQRAKLFAAQQKAASDAQKKLGETLKKDELAKSKDRASAMGAAISKAGGPVASLRDKFGSLKSVLGETGGSAGMGLVTLGAAAAVAAVAVLAAAVMKAGYALAKFILVSGDLARSAGLKREAWSATAQNAANLGTQIDALANKVPTSKEALNDLAIALMKSKLGGEATVDAFNAVGQASAALGDEAGGKIKEFIERGRLMGRMQIDPREMLEGFGNLNFDDVAAELAKGMHVSVAAARKALAEGRVKLGDGAKAMRMAVETKFGGLNLRQMMSLENITKKLHEKLAGLTSGVNLEPLLKPFSELGKLFDDSTVTGQTLKMLVTAFGQGMVSTLTEAIPLGKALFQGSVIGALHLYIAYLKVRNQLRETFGDSKTLKGIDWMKTALEAGTTAMYILGTSAALLGAGLVLAIAPFVLLGKAVVDAVNLISDAFTSTQTFLSQMDWKATGGAIVDGLVDGLKNGAGRLKNAVLGLGDDVKKSFKSALGINSPSTVFAEFGKNTTEGYTQGVEAGSGGANGAVEGMVSPPTGGGAARSSGGGGPIVLNVTINAGGGGEGGQQTAKALSEASFLAQLTKAIEDALVGAGIPVQT